MKRIKRIAAAAMLIALLAGACACSGRAGVGAMLGSNIARVYTPDDRTSRFIMNGTELEGTVTGKAYFDAAADGRSALAWVDTVLYFVSEKGVAPLGADIGTAEISCDGKTALFLAGSELYRYSVETGSSEVIDEGITQVVQFAFSPKGGSVMYTACYEDAPEEYRTKLYKDGKLSPALSDRNAVVIAVNDPADTVWYFDITAQALCAEVNGERTEVSKECGAATNYNFTNDLNEVIFSTSEDREFSNSVSREVFYRLKDGLTCELGTGFGYSLKTDVYSISKVNLFAYVNDASSFLDGYYMLRQKTDDGYVYSLGYLDKKGKATLFTEQAYKYLTAEDGSRIVWLGADGLFGVTPSGKTTKLAEDVSDLVGIDGGDLYYISEAGSLLVIKGNGSPKKLDTGVRLAETFGGACWYVKDYKNGAGTLMKISGGEPENALENVARLDRRAGQLLIYADPMSDGTKTVYTLWIYTAAGLNKTAEGVEP